MEFPYETDVKDAERPIVGVLFYCGANLLNPMSVPVKCLLDTGALHTLLQWETADLFGIDLTHAEDHPDLGLGGVTRTGIKVVHLRMVIPSADGTQRVELPEAPILFIKGDLPVAGLLGSSALRSLVVVFREYEAALNILHATEFAAPDCPHSNGAHPL